MKSKKRINTDAKRLLIGAGMGISFFLLIDLIAAFVLTKTDLSYPVIRYVMVFGVAFSAALGGFVAKRKNRIKGLVCGLISGAAVLFSAYLLLFIFNGYEMTGEALLMIPAALICGTTGGIISSNLR